MFFPYTTDAPIYHWPVATVGLIVVNTAICINFIANPTPMAIDWIMPYGVGLTPLQWLSSMFLHLDLEHLLGNMLFLWVFGLVVEGKIGWQRFLACYLAIGLLQSVGEQSLQILLNGEGGSYGASSAIFGIMAMAAVWAPKNNITVFYWLFFYFGTFEVSILIVAFLYIGMELLFTGIEGFNSSSWLHLGGALLGAPLAILMLKRGIVDCEKWDIFHVMRDEAGGTKKKPTVDAAELAELKQNRDVKLLDGAREQIQLYLSVGNIAAAILLYKKMQHLGDGLQLKRSVLLKFVAALHQEKRWRDSCPFMAELVERFPQESHSVQVKLAQICVLELQKPGKALELLQQLPSNLATRNDQRRNEKTFAPHTLGGSS